MAIFTDYKPLDFSGITKAVDKFQQRQTLSQLGQGIDGSPEGYAKAAQEFLKLGDTAGAQNFFALSEKARERTASLGASDEFQRALSGGGYGTPRSPVAPAAQALGTGSGAPSPRGVAVADTEQDVQRLEAQSSGLTQLNNRNEPRGLRNNNPGNIESGKFAATVQGFQGSDGRFAQYASPEDGIKAADKLLTSYAGKGLNTVAGIVNRWAPPTENDTGAYAASVARELGVDPNQPLDMNNWETRQKLIAAKIRVENGKQPYSEDVFQRALNPNWGAQVAQFEGQGQPQTQTQTAQAGFINNQPPQAGQFAPLGQSQPAAASAGPVGGGGTYAGVDAETLTGYLNNPNVPANLKGLMQAELASRQAGPQAGQVQLAQAGGVQSDAANMPAPNAVPVQDAGGFRVPEGRGQASVLPPNDLHPDKPTSLFQAAVLNPRLTPEQRKYSQDIINSRQAYSAEMAPEKRERERLQTEELRQRVEGEGARPMTAEERQAYRVSDTQSAWITRKGEPKLGPVGTTINNAVDVKGEAEYSKTIGKALGERMDAVSKEGDSARTDNILIGQLRELGGQISNMGAGAALQGRLAEFGIKVGPNVSEIEAYNSIVDKLTPQQRVPGTGATSDRDISIFKSSLPNLIRTPGGNGLILDTLDAIAADKSARAVIADRALAGELKPQDAIKEFRALPDPLARFKEARKSGLQTSDKPAAPRVVATPQDYQSLKSGDTYTDPQGNTRRKP